MTESTSISEADTAPIVPLAVDLDGTLIRSDMMWESLVRLVRCNPFYVFAALFWWCSGRAHLKRQLVKRMQVDPARLPYHEPFLEFLRAEKHRGREIILATASDIAMGQCVAKHTGVFDDVLGSDGSQNLRGALKGRVLSERYGERGFDYAGNSSVDLAVWARAREAIVVNANDTLAARAGKVARLGRTFLEPQPRFQWWLQVLRIQRWPKNILVWLPLFALNTRGNTEVAAVKWTSIAFCLCAAAAYVWNDLMDLDDDRRHPQRQKRPFASGRLPLQAGLFVAPVLALMGLGLAGGQSWGVVGVLGAYLVGTVIYSTILKPVAVLAIAGLAGLNFLRVAAGAMALGGGAAWSDSRILAGLCLALAVTRYGLLRRQPR